MEIKVSKDFERWAKGFSGCDGGNPHGRIWFCGIEYGGNEREGEMKFPDISSPPFLKDEDRRNFIKHQYSRKTVKLYLSLTGEDSANYKSAGLREGGIFGENSDSFKMNLYPISFHHDSDDLWEEWLFNKTGIPTKSIYRAWCQIYRFNTLLEFVKIYSPRLIIGTGLSYENEFLMAFAGLDKVHQFKNQNKPIKIYDSNSNRELEIRYMYINENRTVLAVTPFLGGRYGLNSDILIKNAGSEIANVCEKNFGAIWWNQ